MNTLAVQTYKWSDGSWLNSKAIRSPIVGIYGDVYIYSAPNLEVHDYKITTEIANKNGHLKVVIMP